jgi:hypothetical protein
MKTTRSFLFAALAVAAVVLAGCGKKETPAGAEHKAEPPSRIKHGPGGETIVMLDHEMQTRIGLKSEALAAVQLSAEVKGYGRVVDPAALAALVADFTTAQAANETSQAELKRLNTLAAQSNASERAVQTAAAAAVRDQAQFEAARLKLLANWGTAIASRPGLAAFVQSLGSLETALVRIDLPPGEAMKSPPTGARIASLADEQNPVEAGYFGQLPATDPLTQSRGFLFLVEPNSSKLPPGAAVAGYLKTSGEPASGVVVPRSAVVRHEGAAWVYIETSGTNFARRMLSLDRPLDEGWFVTTGVTAEDRVVTTGGQTVLSEELTAAGFLNGERE